MKENIISMSGSLDKLGAIDGVSFTWKPGTPKAGQRDVGVIAQDVEKVLPEAVHTDENGMKAVDYPRLVPLLINAVKEVYAEVSNLATTVAGFADRLTTKHLHAGEVCLPKSDGSEACISGDQLDALLQQAGQSSATAAIQ